MEIFFKNIRAIAIIGCKLKKINQSDLKAFPRLKLLDLNANNLKVLNVGLFDFNPQLLRISLKNNKISKIHPAVFDNLTHLSTLVLLSNKCIHDESWVDSSSTKRVIEKVKNQCLTGPESISSETLSVGVIECLYENTFWGRLNDHYTCNVQNDLNIATLEDAVITSVTGSHMNGRTNNDVDSIYIKYKNVKHFPKNLEKIFKNLRIISITNSNLMTIYQSDLKPFPELVRLILSNNNIEALEEGLFDFNTQLEMIYISSNQISKIHPNVFDHLTKLEFLELSENVCINMRAGFKTIQNIINFVKNQQF